MIFEFINNYFAVSGVVNAAQELKKKKPRNALMFAILGGTLSFLSVTVFQARKISVTTLNQPLPLEERIPAMIIGSVVFSVLLYAFTFYYVAKWSNKELDVKLGLLVAFVISLLEITIISDMGRSHDVRWLRVASHTLALSVAFPTIMVMIRKAINKKEGKGVLFVIFATLVMSILITLIDYMPYVR